MVDWTNKEDVLKEVETDGMALQRASANLQNDEAVVKEAVKQNGYALQFASDILKNDEAVVKEAVKQNPDAINYAGDALYINALLSKLPPCVKEQDSNNQLNYIKNNTMKNDRLDLAIAKHPDFIPTPEQFDKGLNHPSPEVRTAFGNRADEWASRNETRFLTSNEY